MSDLASSPQSVITYMGRSYEVKDVFPSGELSRPMSSINLRQPPQPLKSSLRKIRSGSMLSHGMQQFAGDEYSDDSTELQPTMRNSWQSPMSLGAAVTSLFLKEQEEEIRKAKFGMHSDSVRGMEFSHDDVANIVGDHNEFARLKATLKKKGAITNEVLKQRFHFYVMAKKGRDAGMEREKQLRSLQPAPTPIMNSCA